MIDHMAVMRRQIEEMQEKALESRSIAEAVLTDVVATVVKESEGGEGITSSTSGFGAASPDYEPPGSPEYIPPQNDMETEVAETPQRYKCSLCGFISEGVVFHLYEHLEKEHGMEDAEEEELEKCCVLICSEQQGEVGAEEEDSAVSKKSEEGLEARSETCVETENKEVAGGAMMANVEVNDEKVDLEEQVFDQKGKVADLSEQKADFVEQKADLKEDEDVIAKAKRERDNTENQEESEDKQEGDLTPSSPSVASGVVSTIVELQEALTETGDPKL